LIELLAVVVIWIALRVRTWSAPGQLFNAFLLSYCSLRFLIEFLKPPYGAAAAGAVPIDRFSGLTAIQWTALAGAAWMAVRMHAARRRSDA
jgi:prolipoprotein diacylglyceryltransferase